MSREQINSRLKNHKLKRTKFFVNQKVIKARVFSLDLVSQGGLYVPQIISIITIIIVMVTVMI